uniref:Uncharacterized protein n=1 Tax=Anguilla anguilla TaxID=7936 RepID=A0A0E9UDD2_ANGAN
MQTAFIFLLSVFCKIFYSRTLANRYFIHSGN